MLLRARGLLDVVGDPRDAVAALGQMVSKVGNAGPGLARRYLVDWEFAWFFTLPIEHLQRFAPRGMQVFQPDPARKLGLMHIGYIRMRPGNLRSPQRPNGVPAFEELTWGVQAQPFERDWTLLLPARHASLLAE